MKKAGFLFFFLALASFRAYPETGLSFAAAAGLAVEASVELRNEYQTLAMREGAWKWGIRPFFPRLGFTASEDDKVSEIGPDSYRKNYTANVEQLLWDGGRLSFSRKMEKAEIGFAGSKLKQAAADIADAAVSVYRDVLQGRLLIDIRKKTLESLEEQLRILRQEYDLGLARQLDLTEAEITVAMAGLEIRALSIDLEESEWRLKEKLGLEKLPVLTERIDTRRSLKLPLPLMAGSFAESRNQDLASLRFSLAMREAEVRAASRSWIPSLRMTGNVGINGSHYPLSRYNWSVGLSIDFSSPWLSGSFDAAAGREPPYDKNASIRQTLIPAPDPGAMYSVRSAKLALAHEHSRYETLIREVHAAAERAVQKCELLDRKRIVALNALELEGEKLRLAELKLSLGEITRIDMMEARLDYAGQEAAVVEAAVAVLRAERELEKFLDLSPGELSLFSEAGI